MHTPTATRWFPLLVGITLLLVASAAMIVAHHRAAPRPRETDLVVAAAAPVHPPAATPRPKPTPATTTSRPATPAPRPPTTTTQAARPAPATTRAARPAPTTEQARATVEHTAPQAATRDYTRAAITGASSAQQYARSIMTASSYSCFAAIVERESGWNVTATNPSSGAYGLMQALPGSKMASEGSDWRYNAATQIRWGLSYMRARYTSPCGAWEFWQTHSYY